MWNLDSISNGSIKVQSPANIAIVKYWGKKEVQIPINPSLSMTLKNSVSVVDLDWEVSDNFSFEFFFNSKKDQTFEKKIKNFFDRIQEFCPYLYNLKLKISSTNTFPHSAGIASSAAFYSALAFALGELEKEISLEQMESKKHRERLSLLARLGSGSACRSLFPFYSSWGEKSLEYASHEETHEIFSDYCDFILIVDSGAKEVSSSLGHKLMENHSYKKVRVEQANRNYKTLKKALLEGDRRSFNEVCIREAHSLHGLMLSSEPPYVLMRPNSLAIISKLNEFRRTSELEFTYTLDAGPNIHLLFPSEIKEKMKSFVENNLISLLENGRYIEDSIGEGPIRLK